MYEYSVPLNSRHPAILYNGHQERTIWASTVESSMYMSVHEPKVLQK
jgi:hypothetical protein